MHLHPGDAYRALLGAAVLALTVLAFGVASAAGTKDAARRGAGCGINTAYLCVQGGTTKLTYSASWLARLRGSGWQVRAISPAVKQGRVLRLPIAKTGKLTLYRRSRVGGLSTKEPGGRCHTDGSLTTSQSAIHHAGGFALHGHGVRRPFDALVLRGNAFYWRGPDHSEQGPKGPGSGTFGGVWSGSPRIDGMVSARKGRTVINQLRVTEEGPLPRSARGVMGKANSLWRVNPYCQVISPDER